MDFNLIVSGARLSEIFDSLVKEGSCVKGKH